jgi:hypothetical protein
LWGARHLLVWFSFLDFRCQQGDVNMEKKLVNKEVIEKLEASKKEALKRIANTLSKQADGEALGAGHSSHTSGTGKGHTSYVG